MTLAPHFEPLTPEHARGWAARVGADIGRGDLGLLAQLKGQPIWVSKGTGMLVTGPTLVNMDISATIGQALARQEVGRGYVPKGWAGPLGRHRFN